MKTWKYLLLYNLLSISSLSFANEAQISYVNKFQTYLTWKDNLPSTPPNDFLEFIKNSSPLTEALREKWLYQIALRHDWKMFIDHYQPSNDLSLQCYYAIANINLGNKNNILNTSTSLWLKQEKPPIACEVLFTTLLKEHAFNDELIIQRIILAIDQKQINLAHDLLMQLSTPQIDEANLLLLIHKNPQKIINLSKSQLHSYFYLYGLKILVARNMDQAIKIWNKPISKQQLSIQQQQEFISKVALYKAMRNSIDAEKWFNLIENQYETDLTIEWHIRYLLLHNNWQKILELIPKLKDNNTPIWQYWKARSLQALGKTEQSILIFTELAKKRNYYGFLSSRIINQKLQFEHEKIEYHELEQLHDYQPVLNQIKNLYNDNQKLTASRMLNAFITEISINERIAIAYWLENELHWPEKAIALSMYDELNNKLELRFPIDYLDTILLNAKKYKISPALIYAIIRQESAFRTDIISFANAYGLMQLLPITAQNTARREKIEYHDPKQLFIPEKNIELGTAYLHQLSVKFNNNPTLMAAAYNAGPQQVKSWLKKHRSQSLDVWIEALPWAETRNYLKNIMAFEAVYSYLLENKIKQSSVAQ